jgi:caa(3)-type oxidase subunit IV
MADSHGETHANGSLFVMYMVVFAALSAFTLLSFIVNWIFPPPDHRGAAIIMSVAVVKALLVAAIFMHLKWDWGRLFFMIIPAFILGAMMMIVLMPDILLAWHD